MYTILMFDLDDTLTDDYENINQTIKSDLDELGQPTRDRHQFIGWAMDNENPTSKFDMLDMTYNAKWQGIEINPDSNGNITVTPG